MTGRTRQATPEEAARFLRQGTPLHRYAYPEDLYPGDPDVARVTRVALRCGRTWPRPGGGDREKHARAKAKHARALSALDAALARCPVPVVRFFAQVVMVDGRFDGATGTGAYIAVASRLVNERARADLKRRGDAWRAAGLDAFATVEAVKEALLC